MNSSQDYYVVVEEGSSQQPRVIRLVKCPARSVVAVGVGLCSSVVGLEVAENFRVQKEVLEVGWHDVHPHRWPISHDDIPERSGSRMGSWKQDFPLASGSGTTVTFHSGPFLQQAATYPTVQVSGDGIPVAKDPVFRELLVTYARLDGIRVEIV
ncbi:MAG: hypothetical protein FD131_5198 [Rhodocyclaceae bacterium]|nr:MAG: hypothetical protein FD131_5198 [Rhodocyclaceae bacterium]